MVVVYNCIYLQNLSNFMFYVYKLYYDTCPEVYIGITSRSLSSRISQHFTELRGGQHHSHKLQSAYSKYGLPNFTELAMCTTQHEACELEKYYISKYNSFVCGFNCTAGGEGTGMGEDSPTAKYLLEDYLCVVTLLANTALTAKEVSDETGVSVHVVRQISSGKTHGYIKDILPEEYAQMLAKNKYAQRHYRDYPPVVSPTGQLYEVSNANEFCRVHGLKQGNFTQLLNGKAKSCCGWKLANPIFEANKPNKPNVYRLIDPNGDMAEFTNISRFAKDNGLDSGSLSRLLNGKSNSHKGYRRYQE